MSDQGFPDDPTPSIPRERRRVPSVTDVVEALSRGRNVPAERRPEVFRAAQQVCAEELRLARTGFAPASLPELVDRAVTLLPPDLGGERVPVRGWEEDAPFPEEPAESVEPLLSPDDPFGSLPPSAPADGPFALPEEEEAPPPETEPPVESPEESEEPEEIEFARVEAAPKGSSGKLATVLLLIAIGGGVWFFARTRRAAPPPQPAGSTPAPEGVPVFPAETATPTPVPAAPEPSKTASPVPPTAATPRAAAPPPAAAPKPEIPESRGSSMITPEWAGRPPAWMIHFSSYQRKENADRDAARLEKLLGRPLRVVSVNLGAQGLWYRVMFGEFGSREEAQRERDALAGKGTPGVGFVYRVEGPPARVAPAR